MLLWSFALAQHSPSHTCSSNSRKGPPRKRQPERSSGNKYLIRVAGCRLDCFLTRHTPPPALLCCCQLVELCTQRKISIGMPLVDLPPGYTAQPSVDKVCAYCTGLVMLLYCLWLHLLTHFFAPCRREPCPGLCCCCTMRSTKQTLSLSFRSCTRSASN